MTVNRISEKGIAVVFILIALLFGFSKASEKLFFEKKAKELAKYNNFKNGCLSLDKVYFYKNIVKEYDVNIDGEIFYYLDIEVNGFPFVAKSRKFYNNIEKDIKCYSIKYVEVYMLFSKRVYIYDLN